MHIPILLFFIGNVATAKLNITDPPLAPIDAALHHNWSYQFSDIDNHSQHTIGSVAVQHWTL